MLVSCAQCLMLVSQARDVRRGSVLEPSVRQMVQGSAALGEEGLAAGAVPPRAGGGYEPPGASVSWLSAEVAMLSP